MQPQNEVFVAWDRAVPMMDYVRGYLAARRLPSTPEWCSAALGMIHAYPVAGVLRKSDLDLFLDRNASRWKPLPPQYAKLASAPGT